MADEAKSKAKDARKARLAQALRANLKRRKAQGRARPASLDGAPEGNPDATVDGRKAANLAPEKPRR